MFWHLGISAICHPYRCFTFVTFTKVSFYPSL
nr:MAG TPA: hypothetical protein [Caudoviricetes sp.]